MIGQPRRGGKWSQTALRFTDTYKDAHQKKENNIWVNTTNLNEGEGGGLPNTVVRHTKGNTNKFFKANQSKKSNKEF